MMRATNAAILFITVWALSGCGGDCMKPRTAEVRNLLERGLKAGDKRERVDEVLKNAGIVYEYDRFQNRYQSTITDSSCGPYQAISVYVYFDASGKMSSVEIFESHTGL
jgi:hypothetical protein